LGPNLFYNSPMEACVVICRMSKPKVRRNKILFINAVNEVTRERAQSFLTDDHIQQIVNAYRDFAGVEGFARVVSNEEVRENECNLNLSLYIKVERSDRTYGNVNGINLSLQEDISAWQKSSQALRESMNNLFNILGKTQGLGGAE